MGNLWDSPITEAAQERFIAEAVRAFGTGVNIEECTLQYRNDFAVGDRAGSASSPFEAKILERASLLSDKTSINARTQDPVLDGSSRLPGDMLIGIFAVAARYVASFTGATPTGINQQLIAAALDDSVLVMKQGALRRFELAGDEFMSVGIAEERSGIAIDTDESNAAKKDRGWRMIKPCVLGRDQQLTLSHFMNRTSDWPQTFSVRYMFPSLIARIK